MTRKRRVLPALMACAAFLVGMGLIAAELHAAAPGTSRLFMASSKGALESEAACQQVSASPEDSRTRGLGDLFSIPGEASILEESHCGIVNGRLTVGTAFQDVARIDGLWAPPYVSNDFQLTLRVAGSNVATRRHVWWPYKTERCGEVGKIQLTTVTALVPAKRAGVLAVTLENRESSHRDLPVDIRIAGTLDRTDAWEFAAPKSKTQTTPANENGRLMLQQGGMAIVVESSGERLASDHANASGRATITLAPGGHTTLYFTFTIGERAAAIAECQAIAAAPQRALQRAETHHIRQVQQLFEKLPRLMSSNRTLVRFYERSLVHLLMNRWEVPEFVLRPYYGTGSVKGGCVCNYLWNFGETWEILPLYDPQAAREHIKQFLRTDLTEHFAFNPITGKAFGPWYMVNQEKIIGLVFYYVKNTGDMKFLEERVEGRTILQHVLDNAVFRDNLAKPVALIDYGPSNSHLELRRGYPYHHVMPDLNGRRYANYRMAARLADIAGKPAPELRQRAEALKSFLKQVMWNRQTRWFDFLDPKGRDTRYTIQIFKLFGSGVLDAEEEAGLLGHLNEREFLDEFGLHSLAKTDIAYDQVDIDNGGGGSCTSFPPQIAERLYKSGHPEVAEDLLRRILWWGARMPYWGDSLVANQIDYRKDTPLQCTIDGVAAAQCILFGMFGIEARWDGSILVCPHPPKFAPEMELQGLRLLGKTLAIRIQGGHFEVTSAGSMLRAKIGECIRLQNGRLSVHSPAAPSGDF